ncbi:esterase/lipase family protein [Streptomyces sp. NPDC055955]|uniref:esterase/lipase family protein n=1 Tax=Streptomyces sp. NPDC055955 TaxID=3345665 RepID=UPI0035D5DECC
MGPTGTSDASRDAVMVLPGIMGSELVDAESGRVLWGLGDARWYARAWTTGASLAGLRVTDEERQGRTGRIVATRLLRFPAFAPVLRGFEPYTALIAGIRRVTAHADAVAEFPYDWRLPIELNAKRLALAAEQHLNAWRAHPGGSRQARLVLVAHSMGGLVARYFTHVLGGGAEVRTVITLGTPYHGAVKAVQILSTGRGAPLPLPRRRLRDLATTLPGLYDLLPSYRCVDEGASARRLVAGDIVGIGADGALATSALAVRERLLAAASGPHTRPLVGVEQRTAQSLTFRDGIAELHDYVCEDGDDGALRRVDRRGDGTVYRDAAWIGDAEPVHLPQTHGAMSQTSETLAHVRAILTERRLGPPLGATAIALDVPDVVAAGRPFDVGVELQTDPVSVSVQVTSAHTHHVLARPRLVSREGTLAAQVTLPDPGLHRIEAKAGGFSPVTQLVLAARPEDLAEG